MANTASKALRERVAAEAGHRCGYCLTDQRVSGAQMHVEHIIPRSRGGALDEANLWLSRAWCNSFKGTQIEAKDPATGADVALYSPRRQEWFEHFKWDSEGVRIVGRTPTGRATVEALKLNNAYLVPARRLWVLAGWHSPERAG